MSLFGSVVQGLSPELVSRVASSIGAPQGAVQKAVDGAAPAIVSAILGATRSDSGVAALTDALSHSASQTETEFTALLGHGFRGVADAGGDALSSIIGGGQMGVLASKLRDFAGLPEGTSGAVLGVVNSVLMRSLKTQSAERGLDGRALVAALNSEKSAIARALPADFARTLEGAGLIEAVSEPLRTAAPQPTAAQAHPPEPRSPEHRAAAAVRAEPVQAEGRPWWQWVAGLVVLGLLLWLGSSLLRGTPKDAVVAAPAKETVAVAPAAIPDASVVATTATGLVDRLGNALAGITDEATARSAVPALDSIKEELASLTTTISGLPEEGRSAVQSILTSALPTLKAATDRLLADTGIAAIIKPALDEITKVMGTPGN